MQENTENRNPFLIPSNRGRKSGYENAREFLEEKYNNNESVEITELAKTLRVAYNTARNYISRFLEEKTGSNAITSCYQYRK